jgi:hypothetical protein
VAATIAERRDHQVGCPVEYGWQLFEIGLRIDEATEADDARDGVEVAKRRPGNRQQIDCALSCSEHASFERDVRAKREKLK